MTTDAELTLLRSIAHNTGDPRHVLLDATALWTTTVANGRLRHPDAVEAMQGLIDGDHIIQWAGGDGNVRYGITTDGVGRLEHVDAPLYDDADRDALTAVIETEASREDPDQSIIGWCNRRLAQI